MRERRAFVLLLCLVSGCAQLGLRPAVPPDPPLKLLVAQITMHAPLSSPADLQSFDQPLSSEEDPLLLARLIEEVEKKAQQLFTEQLAQQPGFHVVPFAEARQARASLDFTHEELDIAQLGALGVQTGADIVLTGRILDYGKIQWQYWAVGLAISMLAETLIVGAATGFNPLIMAATAGSELLTDLPFWWGGAYIAGWAFRPVRIKIKALQITGCAQRIWKEQELVVLIPGKSLNKYSPEERKRKELQLRVNLEESLMELAKSAGNDLRLKPCKQSQQTRGKNNGSARGSQVLYA